MMKKVIILDFDGTLYSGKHVFDNNPEFVNQNKRCFLSNLTDDEYRMICQENPNWKKVTIGNEIVDMLFYLKKKYKNLKISVSDFWNWQNKFVYPLNLNGIKVVDVKLLRAIAESYNCYIVSNSSPKHVKYYLNKLGIQESLFKDIISNKFTSKDITKKHYYEDIIKKENCTIEEVIVLGDSEVNDIEPAILLGIDAIKIKNVKQLNKIFKRLI